MKYVVLALVLMSFVALAEDTEFEFETYQVNTSIDYTGYCYLNGDTCNSSMECSLTVYYPNDSVAINRQNMSFVADGVFNYTISNTTLTVTGVYYAYMNCLDADNPEIIENIADGSFRIVEKTLYEGGGVNMWEAGLPLGVFAFAGILAYFAISFTKKREELQALFWVLSLIIMYTGIDLMAKIAQGNNETNVANLLIGVNSGFIWVIYLVVAYLFITFIITQLKTLGKLK